MRESCFEQRRHSLFIGVPFQRSYSTGPYRRVIQHDSKKPGGQSVSYLKKKLCSTSVHTALKGEKCTTVQSSLTRFDNGMKYHEWRDEN